MNDFERHNQDLSRPEVEISIKQRKEIEYKLINTLKPHSGHKVWEINEKTKEIKEASFVEHKNIKWEDAVKVFHNPQYLREIKIRKGFAYISALNQENALKRYLENKGSAYIPEGSFDLKLF